MKKNLFCIGMVLFGTAPLFGQISKDSLVSLISSETCRTLEAKDFKNKTKDQLEMELGLAMMPQVANYSDEIKKYYGFDGEDMNKLEELGKDVGMKLAVQCPVFLKMFMDNPDALKEYAGSESEARSISGTLIKVVKSDFSYLQVKDENGKMEKIWWMEYFEGSDKLMSDPNKLLNKPVKIKYIEKEMYNATLNEYIKVKVITALN